ncbi:MAG: glycerophosphodiester phosphodiesterase [Actinobacteria bacterium]|nr:glycerophosphodiester phosphodiesterase [Actinomycetota bacterium]
MHRQPHVIAHRGVWGAGVHENSLAAFEQAIEVGADMIELDVRRTRDRELIVFHDAEFAGTPVAELTRPELEDSTGMRPPSLEEALEFVRGRIALDVELKESGYEEELAGPLSSFAASGGDLIVSSFDDVVLARLKGFLPQLECGLLLSRSTERAPERAKTCGATIVLPQVHLVDDASLDELSNAGLTVIVWDFMPEHAALLSEPRISGVITDDVAGVLAARAPI